MWLHVRSRSRIVLGSIALVLPLALLPVYHARGERWVSAAQVSDTVLSQLEELAARPNVDTIVLRDHRASRANLANAFGPASSEVASLISDRPLRVEILPPPHTARGFKLGEIVLALDPVSLRLIPARP
jgi:hypothetical protein